MTGRCSASAQGGELTLTEELRARGFTHRRAKGSTAAMGAHEILDASGAVVATLKANEAWAWLRGGSSDDYRDDEQHWSDLFGVFHD